MGAGRDRGFLTGLFDHVQVPPNPDLSEEFENSNKRFHPSVIGIILAIFMFSISSFISYIEEIGYFDAFYACFITYSTIGFGDIDIYVRADTLCVLCLLCCSV